ncbi:MULTISPECIES: lytic transglycosylase domain-containing protein [unclassified Lysobacter]|uniref:lytic transglycosylase domain-containing protein n=1 Tax=unclassified Lysobacter TaxID=2635362 RepID=UPI001C21909E|nr:lytic transglycosylase domain-containing protein [Lysobacter sp. MMG2]MBU8975787.1 lytic transglycosylase domain-containing protein [Lysobacter sp. MMG2]
MARLRAPAVVLLCVLLVLCAIGQAQARTVYRCVRDGTVSLSTAPEPGSRCTPKQIDDNAAAVPNLFGTGEAVSGVLYERMQDGKPVYGTRKLPGAVKVLSFTVPAPPGEPAHEGLGRLGPPRLDRYPKQFRAAAKATGVDEAWLRAIAHAESDFDAAAVSPKGAQGVMQLMPETGREYGVTDPFSYEQSIMAGARHLRALMRRYGNDMTMVAAAYNAGIGAVTRYGGVPPYAETQAYVVKVRTLHGRYRDALGKPLAKQSARGWASP